MESVSSSLLPCNELLLLSTIAGVLPSKIEATLRNQLYLSQDTDPQHTLHVAQNNR
jgi:hypothetical protein